MRLASYEHDESTVTRAACLRIHGSLFVALAEYAERLVRRKGRRFDATRIAALRTFDEAAWHPESAFRRSARSLFEGTELDYASEIASFAAEIAARDVAEANALKGAGAEVALLTLPLFFAKYADRGGPTLRSIERGRARVEFGAVAWASNECGASPEHPICIGIRAWLASTLAAAGALRVRVEPTTSGRGICPRSLEVLWDERPGSLDFFRTRASSRMADALGRMEPSLREFRLLYAVFSERSGATLIMEGARGRHETAPPALPAMTLAERDVLEGVLAGATDAEIARRRSASTKTVSNQIRSIFAKLGVRSRRELWARYGTA